MVLRPGNGLDQRGEELLARGVDPVQVLDEVDHSVLAAAQLDQALDQPEEPPLPSLGVEHGAGALGVRDSEEVEDQAQVVREPRIQQQETAGDPLASLAFAGVRLDPEVGAQHLQHRHQRNRLPVGLALRLDDLDPLGSAAVGELAAQPALAHPGVGDDPDDLAGPGGGLVEDAAQMLGLLAAADEGAEPRPCETSSLPFAVPRPVSSKTGTGTLDPLMSNSPSSRSSRKPAASDAVLPVRYAEPGSARASIRCASPTVWPIAVYSRPPSSPIEPTTTSPELMPTRVVKLMPSVRRSSSA